MLLPAWPRAVRHMSQAQAVTADLGWPRDMALDVWLRYYSQRRGCGYVVVVMVQSYRLLEARGWSQKGGMCRRPWTTALPAVTQLLKQWHRQWALVVHVSVSQACLSAGLSPDSSG